jgi:hypothetical protein
MIRIKAPVMRNASSANAKTATPGRGFRHSAPDAATRQHEHQQKIKSVFAPDYLAMGQHHEEYRNTRLKAPARNGPLNER